MDYVMKSLKNGELMSWFLQEEPKKTTLIQKKYLVSGGVFHHNTNVIGKYLVGYLEFNMDTGPLLAGSSVKKIFLDTEMNYSDWDIFCSSKDQYISICEKLKNLTEVDTYTTTTNAISFKLNINSTDSHTVQVINRATFNSADELLNSFDFTVCQFITDGHSFKIGDKTLHDERTKSIRLVTDEIRDTFIARLTKYISYGYTPCKELYQKINQPNSITNWEASNDY